MMDELLIATEASLLESHWFRSKPQMQRLLKYLIKYSYENNDTALQQKEIAIQCLGRNSEFIPSQDPIVRIEAARLRKLLDVFYEETQQVLPYRVTLPKGSYRIRFSRNEDNTLSSGLGLLVVCQAPRHASKSILGVMTKVRSELSSRISLFNHIELMVEHLPKHQIAQKGSVHFLAEKQHDYVLRIEVVDDRKGGCLVSSIVIHRISQEILWSDSTLLQLNDQKESLELYYRYLVGTLVANSFGLLGQHWAAFAKQEGLENLPSHQGSWVHLIDLSSRPSAPLAREYLAFLKVRLKKSPNDHFAYSGYLYLVFYDLLFGFELVESSLEERYEQALRAASEYPTYDAFTVLLGLYSLALGKHEDAKVYLDTGIELNPHNACWAFFYGGALLLMGEKEKGFSAIERLNKEFGDSDITSRYYLLPKFLYYVEKEDPAKVFQISIKLGLDCKQGSDIGALKSDPDLISNCWKAIKSLSLIS